jgi:WD40 repeat protein
VNDVAFSADGSFLFSASGENPLIGEVKQWRVADGSLVQTFEGHKDTIYACAISPDGKTVATGSYDQDIKLWSTETGKEIKTLHGHNGAVFGLSFRPDGKILASASADRTVKLWNVEKGERTDTLQQPLKEVYCVAWAPDGKKLYAGSADNRIRVWSISDTALENTDPILESKFAHEGSILRLTFSTDGKLLLSSADDRTVKLWDAATLREKLLLEKQPDWVAGLCLVDNTIVTGRMDGSLGFYDLSGKAVSTNLTTAALENKTGALTK